MAAHPAATRTTVKLDRRLLAEARRLALATGHTLSDLVEDALRQLLHRKEARGGPNVELPVKRLGVRPGVDLDDNASVRDLMDDSG